MNLDKHTGWLITACSKRNNSRQILFLLISPSLYLNLESPPSQSHSNSNYTCTYKRHNKIPRSLYFIWLNYTKHQQLGQLITQRPLSINLINTGSIWPITIISVLRAKLTDSDKIIILENTKIIQPDHVKALLLKMEGGGGGFDVCKKVSGFYFLLSEGAWTLKNKIK